MRRSLERSVMQTWTGSSFSTNESAWSVMVTGSYSLVWSGPQFPLQKQPPDYKLFSSILSYERDPVCFYDIIPTNREMNHKWSHHPHPSPLLLGYGMCYAYYLFIVLLLLLSYCRSTLVYIDYGSFVHMQWTQWSFVLSGLFYITSHAWYA